MGRDRYRRSTSQGASTAVDASDPYGAYLAWVAEGRPSLAPSLAGQWSNALPEAGTILLTEHVQVQENAESTLPPLRQSPWQRLTGAVRRALR